MSMKTFIITFFTVLFCLNSSVGYSQNIICEKTGYSCPEINFKDLVKRDGVYYKKFSDEPYTGKVTGLEQGSLKNGLKAGFWVKYFDNGQLYSKGHYKSNKLDGVWIYNHRNGQLHKKFHYKNNKVDGTFVNYYKNGNLHFKVNYNNDLKNGSWIKYWNNGQLGEKGNYKNNKREGSWVYYWDSGKLSSKGKYKNDKKEGYWITYGFDKEVVKQYSGTYKNGKKISD